MEISTEQFQQIVQAYHPQAILLKSWSLTGGISAQIVAIEIGLPDNITQQIVLRVHGEKDRANNPNIAHDEFKLLSILYRAGLPVPKPYHVNASNTILTTPYLLIDYIENDDSMKEMDIAQRLHSLIDTLINIHTIDLAQHDFSFLPHQSDLISLGLQSAPSSHKHIVNAMDRVLPFLTTNPYVLLHGDYWLGNLLWRDRQIIGIIDWEDAMIGDPLSDLGKSRLELTWVAGEHITDQYTQLYAQQMIHLNMSYLPFWDLWGALRLADFADWFDDPAKVEKMQILYDEFVEQAIEKLHAMEE